MKCHFEPPRFRKFGAPARRNKKSRRHMYIHLYDENGLKRVGEKALSRRAAYTKPQAPKFRRKQERIAQLRYTYIQMQDVGNSIGSFLFKFGTRRPVLKRALGLWSADDEASWVAQDIKEWKPRWLANQRYLKPRLHPGGSPRRMLADRIVSGLYELSKL